MISMIKKISLDRSSIFFCCVWVCTVFNPDGPSAKVQAVPTAPVQRRASRWVPCQVRETRCFRTEEVERWHCTRRHCGGAS